MDPPIILNGVVRRRCEEDMECDKCAKVRVVTVEAMSALEEQDGDAYCDMLEDGDCSQDVKIVEKFWHKIGGRRLKSQIPVGIPSEKGGVLTYQMGIRLLHEKMVPKPPQPPNPPPPVVAISASISGIEAHARARSVQIASVQAAGENYNREQVKKGATAGGFF